MTHPIRSPLVISLLALLGAVGCSTAGDDGGNTGGSGGNAGGSGGSTGVAGGSAVVGGSTGIAGGNPGGAGGIGGGSGDVKPFATTPGEGVFVGGLTRAIFVSHGGGLRFRPQGAACDDAAWTYTLDIEAGSLSWAVCRVANSGAAAADYVPETGSRVLLSGERKDAYVALGEVHVSAGGNCGADKGTWDLTVVSPLGMLTYGDDFYSCIHIQEHFVESGGLSALFAALSPLAHQ